MTSRFKYLVCTALFAVSLAACNNGRVDTGQTPVAEVRVQLDAGRSRVWLLTRQGLGFIDAATPDKVRKLGFPDWQFAGRTFGCLPDLALGPNGEIVVTSDVMPVLWRVDPDTLNVTRHDLTLDADNDKDVGFTIIRFVPAQGVYLAVSEAHGTLWRINRRFKYAHRMMRQLPRSRDCGVRAESLMRQLGMLWR